MAVEDLLLHMGIAYNYMLINYRWWLSSIATRCFGDSTPSQLVQGIFHTTSQKAARCKKSFYDERYVVSLFNKQSQELYFWVSSLLVFPKSGGFVLPSHVYHKIMSTTRMRILLPVDQFMELSWLHYHHMYIIKSCQLPE